MKMATFWDIAQCSFVEVYRRFRDTHFSILRAMTCAVYITGTPVFFNETTRRYIPEGRHLKIKQLVTI
jgi:hypothetical protein